MPHQSRIGAASRQARGARRLLLGLAAAALLPAAPRAAEPRPGPEALAAHRAGYALSLDRARDPAGIAGARGVMVFEVLDACEGWATRQRFTLVLTDRDGQQIETASDYATYETKDGRSLRFSLTQTTEGAVSQRIAGEAELRADGSGRVRYTEPEAKEEALPEGTLLPMRHTLRALQTAREGGRMLIAPLFDGTSADGAQDSTTVIAGWHAPQANERFPALSALASARMRVAFFDRQDTGGGGASAPSYEVGLRYWENGVADELKMDFGDFVVDGRLEELAILPSNC
ncbi:cell envelope integrity EipB family protein [Crenalkalicoccus roseus]|uniref:cell envelope integrity EipB family protein n=1 Tax=Crenalkalicoccus roseus TaxID=1485588 RepID=UPI00108134B5|nr:cell envelope integrity EipB family protein [Crenalkalicoccus roseus]